MKRINTEMQNRKKINLIQLRPYRLVRPRISRSLREDRGSNPLGDAN